MTDSLHDIFVITFNRPKYTQKALKRLLESCDEQMRVWVWHNGGHAETLAAVRDLERHPNFYRLYVSEENKKLREPTNWFWQHADGEYLTKVDDDCLLPDGWAHRLRQAHHDEPLLGVVGCWRFYDEDFVPDLAGRKIMPVGGGHRIMVNCWVQGSGYVMKRAVVGQLGSLGPRESFTDYCVRAAAAGWTNGWYYPFIHEEHMDDPRSIYSELRCDEDFRVNRPLSAIRDDVQSLEEWKNRVKWMARSVQAAPTNPTCFFGWRRKLNRGFKRLRRLAGWREPWRLGQGG